MAVRKILVQVNGQIQQLQSGDTVSIPTISGGTQITQTNDESGSIVIGTPVYNDVADGVKKAKADASGTVKCMGIVADTSISSSGTGAIQVDGVITATTGQWDTVAGTSGGLAAGTRYYLSAATAGQITSVAPSTVGQYVQEVGIALSTTELKITLPQSILL